MTNLKNIAIEAGRKQIEVSDNGSIMIDGPEGVNLYRLLMIKSGMEFEAKTGMKLTGKAPSCFVIVRREFGFKGTKKEQYEQFCDHHGFEKKDIGEPKALKGRR